MTARKRDKGRSRAEPDRIAINVRLTAEQRDALTLAAGTAPLAAWARETLLRAAGRADLGIAATVAALGGPPLDRVEAYRREHGRMPDDVAGRDR